MEVHPAVVPGDEGEGRRLTPAADEGPAPPPGAAGQPGTTAAPETEESWIVIPEEDPRVTLEEDLVIDFGEQRLEILPEEPETTARLEEPRSLAATDEGLRAEALAAVDWLTATEDDSVGGNPAEKSWVVPPTEEWQQTMAPAEEELRPVTPPEEESETVAPAEQNSASVSVTEEHLRALTLANEASKSEIPAEQNSKTVTPADEELPAPTNSDHDSQTVTPAEEEPVAVTHAEEDIKSMAHAEDDPQTATPGGENSRTVTLAEDVKPKAQVEEESTKATPAEQESTTVTAAGEGTKPITPLEDEAETVTGTAALTPAEDGELRVMADAEEESRTATPAEEHSQPVTPAEQESRAASSAEPTTATLAEPETQTPNHTPEADPTAQLLLAAAEVSEGDVSDFVKRLVEAGADLEATSTQAEEKGLRALHLACWGGNAALVTQLLHLGADSTSLAWGRQPVHWAAYGGHVGALEALAAAGVPLNVRTAEDDSTPLHLAAENGNEAAAQWLVEHGVSVLARRADGAQAARLAREAGRRKLYAHLTHRSKAEQLLTAATAGHAEAVRQLLARGADVDVCSYMERTRGWSALHLAAEGDKLEAVEALLEAGANVEAKACDGLMAIHVAARAGSLRVVQVLLPRLQGHPMDEAGLRLVHAAAEGGDVSIMQYLHYCGCDIHARCTPGGQTALHVAARLGHALLAKWLVEEGVSAEERDAAGLTALDCAWMAGQTVVLNVLAFQ